MGQIPEPPKDEEDTQEWQPFRFANVMIETDMQASAPILDDLERLLNHFEDSTYIRRWVAEQRQQRRYSQPY